MRKIMFNDKYYLTALVLGGSKEQTRRIAYEGELEYSNVGFGLEGRDKGRCVLCKGTEIVAKSAYKIGEVVAIAQAYQNITAPLDYITDAMFIQKYIVTGGWDNKMFVQASKMPHHLMITNIRVERLQDISDDDCIKEGVCTDGYRQEFYTVRGFKSHYTTPKEAFAVLIDKTCGKGTWKRNPFVFVYEFKRID